MGPKMGLGKGSLTMVGIRRQEGPGWCRREGGVGGAPSSGAPAALSVPSVPILVSAAPPSGILWKRRHDLVPASW